LLRIRKDVNHPFKADIKDALSSSFNKVWQRGKRGERIKVWQIESVA
jgi:hypothetical protein